MPHRILKKVLNIERDDEHKTLKQSDNIEYREALKHACIKRNIAKRNRRGRGYLRRAANDVSKLMNRTAHFVKRSRIYFAKLMGGLKQKWTATREAQRTRKEHKTLKQSGNIEYREALKHACIKRNIVKRNRRGRGYLRSASNDVSKPMNRTAHFVKRSSIYFAKLMGGLKQKWAETREAQRTRKERKTQKQSDSLEYWEVLNLASLKRNIARGNSILQFVKGYLGSGVNAVSKVMLRSAPFVKWSGIYSAKLMDELQQKWAATREAQRIRKGNVFKEREEANRSRNKPNTIGNQKPNESKKYLENNVLHKEVDVLWTDNLVIMLQGIRRRCKKIVKKQRLSLVIQTDKKIEFSTDIETPEKSVGVDIDFSIIDGKKKRILPGREVSHFLKCNEKVIGNVYAIIKMHMISTILKKFPRFISGFKRFIREDMLFSAKRPSEYHGFIIIGYCLSGEANFRMGLHSSIIQRYAVVCAHRLLPPTCLDLRQYRLDRVNDFPITLSVCQPCGKYVDHRIGEVFVAVIHDAKTKSMTSTAGLDRVIKEIQNRSPRDGYFHYNDQAYVEEAEEPKSITNRRELKEKTMVSHDEQEDFKSVYDSAKDQLENILQGKRVRYQKVWIALKCSEKNKRPLLVVETNGETEYSTTIDSFKKDVGIGVEFAVNDGKESSFFTRMDMSILQDFDQKTIERAYAAIDMITNSMFSSHCNAVYMDVSGCKSTSFGTEYATCDKELTIVIYTRIKGYIPLGEGEFPKFIGGFKTDIRKGIVVATTKSSERHENLRCGCRISGKVQLSLTLGPFFVLPKTHELFALTCAHGLISPECLRQHGIDKVNDLLKNSSVYQPSDTSVEDRIGEVISAVIWEGRTNREMSISGVDGAIIKIQNRKPRDGCFPDADQWKIDAAGLDSDPKYDSGRIERNISKIKDKILIMYGQESLFQRGTACLSNQRIKLITVNVSHGDFKYTLHQQIKVLPIPNEEEEKEDGSCKITCNNFAQRGDSGGAVFIIDGDQLVLVGILCASTDFGPAFVTPIKDFLQAFHLENLTEMLTFRNQENDRAQSNASGESIEQMEVE